MKNLSKWTAVLLPVIALAGVVAYVTYRTRRVPTPRRRWQRFDRAEAQPLPAGTCQGLQGIYAVEEAGSFLGKTAVLKCSYTIEKENKVYHLSLFCEKDGTYLLCEGKQLGNDILLCGHWRKTMENGTGLAWLEIRGGAAVLSRNENKPLTLTGHIGRGDKEPTTPVCLRFMEALPALPPFDIIAHRGGSRNVDFLPVSENSVEMTKLAARLGANGIEIDVRMTNDGVPVIFHDSFLSVHTVKGIVYGGLLHNYTWEELQQLELRKGGRIPTLEEMLDTVLYQTPLEVVWLDIKKECDLEMMAKIQDYYHRKAADIDRKLTIYIGIPDDYILGCFKKLDNYADIPSLIELDWPQALAINAQVWAPQYTGGFQADDTDQVHAAGKKAYVWSLDAKWMVESYMQEGRFDGMVTNSAPVVAHWLYTEGARLLQPAGQVEKQPLQAGV